MKFFCGGPSRGVAGLEQLAMELKLKGVFLSRQISYEGVKFIKDEVHMSDDFKIIYKMSTELVYFCNLVR